MSNSAKRSERTEPKQTRPTKKPRKPRTDAELRAAHDLILYDAAMLQSLSNGLSTGVLGAGPVGNAVLESLLLHARILISFMYDENARADDVLAADFYESETAWYRKRPDLPENLKKAQVRTNKELAHLTYLSAAKTPEEKVWPFTEISAEVLTAFRIFEKTYTRTRPPHEQLTEPYHFSAVWLTSRPKEKVDQPFTVRLTPALPGDDNIVPIAAEGYYNGRQFKGGASLALSQFVSGAAWEETVRNLFKQWCIDNFNDDRIGQNI